MDLEIKYEKGRIIIHPPKDFEDLENPFVDDPKMFRRFMVTVFRAVFYYFKEKVYTKSRVSFGKYKCSESVELQPRKNTAVDHIKPIISLEEKENDWNGIVSRCFDLDNSQLLSNDVHAKKTAAENSKRFKGKKKPRKK